MPKTIPDMVFFFDPNQPDGGHPAYISVTARDLNLKESWFRESIAQNPDLVILPCEKANLTDEQWFFWKTEFPVKTKKGNTVGKIDVLLLSESGRIGIIETKLAYNPEKRRDVLAQVLDYAVHLSDMPPESMPDLPVDEGGDAVVGFEDMALHLADGDFLIVVAGDELDERAVRLSAAILGDHQINPWDLAMVDLSLYQREKDENGAGYIIIPALRLAHVATPRHIVRVLIEGDYKASKVSIERPTIPANVQSRKPYGRQSWDIDRFFAELKSSSQPPEWVHLGEGLYNLTNDYEGLSFSLGTGKNGTITLKRKGQGLIEFYINGKIRFRKRRFKLALGNKIGQQYEEGLAALLSPAFKLSMYPTIKMEAVVPVIDDVLSLIKKVVAEAEKSEPNDA
jgi:hypothetical protein